MSRVVEIPRAMRKFDVGQIVTRKGKPLLLNVVQVDRDAATVDVMPRGNDLTGRRWRLAFADLNPARYLADYTRAEMATEWAKALIGATDAARDEALDYLMRKQREALGCATDAEVDALPTVEKIR